MTNLAILTRQVGHYHDARYRAAVSAFSRVTVVSTASEGPFVEFLAKRTDSYNVLRLYANRLDYEAAVVNGALAEELSAGLDQLAPHAIAVPGWTNPECMIAIRWGRHNDVPIIMMSESQVDDAGRSFAREIVKSRIVSLCDAALVGGPSHASYIKRLGMPDAHIHLGYNAVDNEYFAKGSDLARSNELTVRNAYGLPSRYILASARFIKKKNLTALVTAYGLTCAASAIAPDLVLLGDGEMKSAILDAAATGGVADRVHLLGFKGYDVLPAHYGLAEAFVHVSTTEQWGLVVNEAMAAGLPVVVSEPCGVGRTLIKNGVNGLIVEPDVSDIAAGLMTIIQMTQTARTTMGLAARKSISAWGPKRFGDGMLAAVEGAMKRRRRGRPALWDEAILAHMERELVHAVS